MKAHSPLTKVFGGSVIAAVVATGLFAGAASANELVPLTEWRVTGSAPAAPYLVTGAEALNSGYEWRHLGDGSGRIYMEYRTDSGRTFVTLIDDPAAEDDDG